MNHFSIKDDFIVSFILYEHLPVLLYLMFLNALFCYIQSLLRLFS